MVKETLYDKLRDKRKKQIITSAKRYFLKNGLSSSINMKTIALSAKISRQTLYKYYKNIDQVILAVHESVINETVSYIKNVHVKKDYYLDSIKEAINLLFKYVKERKNDALFLTLFYSYAHNKQYKNAIEEDYLKLVNEIPNIFGKLEDYKNDPTIRNDLNADIAKLVVINCITGTIQTLLLAEEAGVDNIRLNQDAVIKELTTMIERYLKP